MWLPCSCTSGHHLGSTIGMRTIASRWAMVVHSVSSMGTPLPPEVHPERRNSVLSVGPARVNHGIALSACSASVVSWGYRGREDSP